MLDRLHTFGRLERVVGDLGLGRTWKVATVWKQALDCGGIPSSRAWCFVGAEMSAVPNQTEMSSSGPAKIGDRLPSGTERQCGHDDRQLRPPVIGCFWGKGVDPACICRERLAAGRVESVAETVQHSPAPGLHAWPLASPGHPGTSPGSIPVHPGPLGASCPVRAAGHPPQWSSAVPPSALLTPCPVPRPTKESPVPTPFHNPPSQSSIVSLHRPQRPVPDPSASLSLPPSATTSST